MKSIGIKLENSWCWICAIKDETLLQKKKKEARNDLLNFLLVYIARFILMLHFLFVYIARFILLK